MSVLTISDAFAFLCSTCGTMQHATADTCMHKPKTLRLIGDGPRENSYLKKMTEAHSLLGEDKRQSFETASRSHV